MKDDSDTEAKQRGGQNLTHQVKYRCNSYGVRQQHSPQEAETRVLSRWRYFVPTRQTFYTLGGNLAFALGHA